MNSSSQSSRKFTCIDLFAGCGGLSLGLARGGFEVLLAVEKSDMAGETYYHNLIRRLEPVKDDPEWSAYLRKKPAQQINRGLLIGPVKQLLTLKALRHLQKRIRSSGQRTVDLIAGGPPCQGFSMAGRRRAGDARNDLPHHFLSLVNKLKPRLVVMENVGGFRLRFDRDGLAAVAPRVEKALQRAGTGYLTQMLLLDAAHFGVPQHRPRVLIVGVEAGLAKKLNLRQRHEPIRSFWRDSGTAPTTLLPPSTVGREEEGFTVRDAIEDLLFPAGESDGCNETNHPSYAQRMQDPRGLSGDHLGGSIRNHVKRKHSERVTTRFRLYQALSTAGLPGDWFSCNEAKLRAVLRENARKCFFPLKSPDDKLVVKTVDEFVRIMAEHRTKKHSQRALRWDEPSPTVLTLPDDFVHPSEPRTLTVREMARIQSFPDGFEFRSKETTGGARRKVEVPQYTQVGNAVPPLLAEAVGKCLAALLRKADGVL